MARGWDPDLYIEEDDARSEALLGPDDIDVTIIEDDLFPEGFHEEEGPPEFPRWPNPDRPSHRQPEWIPEDWDIPPEWWTPLTPLPGGVDGNWGSDAEIPGGPWSPHGPSGPLLGPSSRILPIKAPSTVLGYYIPRHKIELMMIGRGLDPGTRGEFERFERTEVPSENRFGIHLLKNNIRKHIHDHINNAAFQSQREVQYFSERFRLLFWTYVLGHEWGHYLAEVIAVENMRTLRSAYGDHNVVRELDPRYLDHFYTTTSVDRYRRNDYEEVFAEWSALRYGVFNLYLRRSIIGQLAHPGIPRAIKEKLMRDWVLKGIIVASVARSPRPYRDIARWIDCGKLLSHKNAEQYVGSQRTISNCVPNALVTSGGHDALTPITVMENNLNVFSRANRFATLAGHRYGRHARFCPSTGYGFLPHTGHRRPIVPVSLRGPLGVRYPRVPRYSPGTRSESFIRCRGIPGMRTDRVPLVNFTDVLRLPEVMVH